MEITGQKREETGKKVKKIRLDGGLPASVFGSGIESTPITLNLNEFIKVFREAGETSLVDLKVDKDEHKVLIKEIQFDPVTDQIIHVGLYKPDLTEKTEVQVPVEAVGEEQNELIKSGQGIVLLLMNEITVSALPTDLPDSFEVDVSDLAEIGDGVTIGQLQYDRDKVEIPDLEEDELVLKIDYAEMEEEEEEEELTEEEAIEQMEATEEKDEEEVEGEQKDKKLKEDTEEKAEGEKEDKKDSK